ncbi:hypothetical protein [Cryobacterium sp. Y11]|nr:hypothetical protein [Cryobacterium sp. Y11]
MGNSKTDVLYISSTVGAYQTVHDRTDAEIQPNFNGITDDSARGRS